MIYADEITPRLFMGPIPLPGPHVAQAGFSVLILAASPREYRVAYGLKKTDPIESVFPGVPLVFVVGLTDDYEVPVTESEFRRVMAASETVKHAVREHRKALVTCMMGRNRSGLVTALALRELCNWSGARAIQQVRAGREKSGTKKVLENPMYVELLERLPVPREVTRPKPVLELPRHPRYRRAFT